MQNTTADYKLEINKPSRSFECKITIGDNIYTNEDLVNLTLEFTQPQEGFSIGGTISKSLDLTLLNKGDIIYSTSQIKVEIGLKIGSKIEYILMGIFNIDDIEKTDYTRKFTCYDNMIKFETAYFSSLGDKPTLQQVVNELSSKTGVEFTGSLPAYTVSKLDGFSCREVLSYVASICGGNAFITRDGKFTIKSLSEVEKAIDGNNYFDYKREEVKYKVGQISCQVDENNILSKGSIGTDSMELGFENPWITEAILNDVYNKLNGVSYLGYSMKWQGDLSLDPYDIITVTDIKNVVRKIPILSQKISYTGGLTSEIGAKGETKNKNSFSSSGSTTNKVNRLVTEQAVIKEALIEKANIKDVEAVSIRTQTLEAKTAKIEEAIIDVAHIKDLNAINANIQNLIAADATINNALIGKADITELNAVKGTINVLESDTANIKNLLAGNISGESGQLIHLTASNVVIADAVIKDLIAVNISVGDLKASTISTNKFSISSTDGGLSIVGPTMQFKDTNNKVRIQMGQDATGNFNFILRGEDGTTTLIDHTGIKENAIADDLIKENMVAADAIGEKQINYSSLITGLNKDTNTSLIKASKVAIDLTGQSLEVSFNSLKSNIENMEIGGRNLFISSNVGSYAGGNIYSLTGATYKDFKFTVTSNPTDLVGVKVINFDKELMISGETDLEEITPWWKFDNSSQSNTRISVINGKFSFKISVPNGATTLNIGIGLYPYIKGYFIKNIMIQNGNKATDWTPAPEDVDQKIESNTTAITVAQGKIEGLIKESSIIKGDITTISDKYTSIKATVDGINTTVASHTSSIGTINTNISGLSGKVTTVENNYASLSQNLEGFKTTVVNNYSTKSELNGVDGKVSSLTSRVSTAESSITQLNNKIALKVEATDVTEAINNIQIGARNLTLKSKHLNDNSSAWTVVNIKVTKSEDYMHFSPITTSTDGHAYFWENSYKRLSQTLVKGKTYTMSFDVRTNCSRFRVGFRKNPANQVLYDYRNSKRIGEWDRYYFTFVWSDHDWDNILWLVGVYEGGSDKYIDVKYWKLEEGNKPTDWTPAPEDVDSSIANVQTQITTTSNKVATIETNLSSITQRVSSTESTVSTHTTQLGTVDSRINTAKNSAISTAASDATTKANNAQNKALADAKTYTNGQITTVNKTITDRVAEIKATTDSITQKVSATESKVTTINGNVTSLQSRMTTAEQKITPTAITTTISSVITGGTGSISTTQFVMDKNGLTIKNGALTIQNKAGTTVFTSDTNGNLIFTGTAKSQFGSQWVGLDAGGITFQDSQRNEQMLRAGLSYFESNRDMNGVNFALAKYGDFIRFSHIAKTDLTNGWSPSDTQYNFFDCWSGDQSVNGVAFKKGINVYAPMYVNSNGILFNNDSNFTSDIRGATWNTMTNLLGIFGDNGLSLGYRNGSAYEARIVMTEGSHPGTDDKIKSWGHWNGSGYVLHNFEVRATALSVSGSKNCIQKTESYGERLINAYETAEYYFGDLGFGKINEDGECLISIDDIFLECINTDAEYHVFTQTYIGTIKTIERYKTYFIVKGDPGTSFSWELKAKRIGYENNRLDTQSIVDNQAESNLELFSDEDFKIKTSENTLMDIITYSLEDLLMEG